MAKQYVPVVKANRKYKIYVDDIKKVHQITKRMTPPIPSYNGK